jgi:hypothetical protein
VPEIAHYGSAGAFHITHNGSSIGNLTAEVTFFAVQRLE